MIPNWITTFWRASLFLWIVIFVFQFNFEIHFNRCVNDNYVNIAQFDYHKLHDNIKAAHLHEMLFIICSKTLPQKFDNELFRASIKNTPSDYADLIEKLLESLIKNCFVSTSIVRKIKPKIWWNIFARKTLSADEQKHLGF